MLFNSFEFCIFLPIVYLLYWRVFSKNKTTQNSFLLVCSYIFYAFWNWKFCFLLAFSTILDFTTGLIIDESKSHKKRRLWMQLSIITNIGILCYFKYFNFFIHSFIKLFSAIGIHTDINTLNIILPIGISFYTFHGVSYVLDIYYRRIKAHKNIIDYSLFVSYFPLLVAGPIERANHLLPQLKVKRAFKYQQGVEGCKLILWGIFKKVVIADSLAPIVQEIFQNYQTHTGVTLILGILGFAFQVYGDFSGYTDIARGVSKLLGIDLILNFNFPYLSKSIPEFWSRWHISLSSWLNDYVFTPLALNFRNLGKHGVLLAVFLTFLISGLWHGAGWNFIAWGAFHGLLYIPSIYSKKGLKSMISKKQTVFSIKDLPQILLTFSLVCIGYVFFRAHSMHIALHYLQNIVLSIKRNPAQFFQVPLGKSAFIYFILLILGDWYLIMEERNLLGRYKRIIQLIVYQLLIILTYADRKSVV